MRDDAPCSSSIRVDLKRLGLAGGTVSEICCISVVAHQYGQMQDGWIMALLMQV